MKRINDIQAWMGAAALCLSSCPLSAQQVVPTGEPVLSWQDSTQLKVAFSVAAGDVEITSDDRLILTPRLTTKAGDTLTLPPVELAGKRNRRYFDRRAALRGEERVAVAAAADTFSYNKVVGVEPWMRASALSLTVDCEFENCCDVRPLAALDLGATRWFTPKPKAVMPVLSVAEQIAVREPVLKPISEYKPYTRDIPLRKMKDALYVHFPVGKWDLREDFRDNEATLARIVDMMRRVKDDKTSSIVKVVIVGLASIEGSVAFNEHLAGRRAEVLKDYLDARVDMPDDVYEVVGAGEAWADLRDVIAESDLDERQELLQIIDNTPDENLREQRIRKLNGGRPYQYLKQSVFADQRNSGYIRAYYEAVPDKGAEAINRAVALVREGRDAEAVTLLEPLADERKWNTLGVAYFKTGHRAEAVECFERAVKAGDSEAAGNLEGVRAVEGR